jgi:bile-acid 7alpha-dehydratase
MTGTRDLEARIQALEDIEAIKRLKYRYFRCLDLKLWDELAACFTPDASVDYAGGKYAFQGVEAIMRFLVESLGEARGSRGTHHGHQPEIDLTGPTTARGTWALDNYLFNPAEKRNVRIGAYYHDEYVKVGGAWRIHRTGYTLVYHEEWSRDDVPSLHLVAP